MKLYKQLSLDESGKASYSHASGIFILSGVVIPEALKPKIQGQMRKIKKRYFEDEEIILHGRDLSRAGGSFSTLADSKVATKFWSDFVAIVNHPDIALYFVVVDKAKSKRAGWQTKTILQRSYLRILSEFARSIKALKYCGRITNESDAEQDPYLIYAHNRLQSNGTGDGSVSGREYQQLITSLSLVNKANNDVDLQIADTFAFAGRLKYEKEILHRSAALTQAEKVKYRLIDRKLANTKNPGLFEVLI